jgi:hypothetical protein
MYLETYKKKNNYLVLPRISNFMKYQGIYASYSLILKFIKDGESTTKILGVKYNIGVHVLIPPEGVSTLQWWGACVTL